MTAKPNGNGNNFGVTIKKQRQHDLADGLLQRQLTPAEHPEHGI